MAERQNAPAKGSVVKEREKSDGLGPAIETFKANFDFELSKEDKDVVAQQCV